VVGTVELIPAGALVYDAAFPPSAAALAADGGAACLRYYAPAPDGSPRLELNAKNLKPTEPADFAAAGIALGINGEWGELTMLHGTAVNLALGRAVRVGCARDGVPDETPLWWSCDTQCDPPQYELTRIALAAYRVDNPDNPFGLYSNSQHIEWALDEGLVDYGWIASAPWWSRTTAPVDNVTVFLGHLPDGSPFHYYLTPRAHLRQYGHSTIDGHEVDLNRAQHPAPFWYPGGIAPAPDPPEDPVPDHVRFAKSPARGIVELVVGFDGLPAWQPTSAPGFAGLVFAEYPGGADTIPAVGDAELDAMGEYDPALDAQWLGSHLGIASGLVQHVHDNGVSGPAVAP
jgi:hypothetical protein